MNFKTNPLQPRPTRRRRMAVDTFGWILHELSRHSEAIHCQPPEEPRACHPGGDRRSRRMMWHGHPADHGGVGARLGMARETRGEAANNTITATTSHQAPQSGRLHSQTWWHMGNREQMRQGAWPSSPANQCADSSCSMGARVCAMVAHDGGMKHTACKHKWGKKVDSTQFSVV